MEAIADVRLLGFHTFDVAYSRLSGQRYVGIEACSNSHSIAIPRSRTFTLPDTTAHARSRRHVDALVAIDRADASGDKRLAVDERRQRRQRDWGGDF
jgi:hypothetical protein